MMAAAGWPRGRETSPRAKRLKGRDFSAYESGPAYSEHLRCELRVDLGQLGRDHLAHEL
jgi:hypothetical protein